MFRLKLFCKHQWHTEIWIAPPPFYVLNNRRRVFVCDKCGTMITGDGRHISKAEAKICRPENPEVE
jgi:hypothetical protein